MRNLIRQPLTWMVAAEVIVVLLLMLVVWSLVASAASQRSPAALLPAVASPVDASAPPPPGPTLARGPKAPRQLPGLNLSPDFWRLRLDRLNREQVTFEQLEWRVVHAAMDALQRYLETVVLPSIVRAERV